jgi:hypothetical protein
MKKKILQDLVQTPARLIAAIRLKVSGNFNDTNRPPVNHLVDYSNRTHTVKARVMLVMKIQVGGRRIKPLVQEAPNVHQFQKNGRGREKTWKCRKDINLKSTNPFDWRHVSLSP